MTVFAPGFKFEDYPQGRSSLKLDEQIDAFQRTWTEWHLNIALALSQTNPNAGFAVLSILNPYFEMIARHHDGLTSKEAKRQTGKLAVRGLDLVFPNLDKQIPGIAELLYESLRCSIAHIGLTGRNVELNDKYPGPIVINGPKGVALNTDNAYLVINPRLWAEHLKLHFDLYVSLLKDPSQVTLRNNFSRCFLSSL